jgi:hypothetical protein
MLPHLKQYTHPNHPYIKYYPLCVSPWRSIHFPNASCRQRWIPHLKIKQYHFEAAAQFRRSMDDSENARYGLELARLAQASQWARRGIESQHPEVARLVIQDIQASTIEHLLPSSLVLKLITLFHH